MFNAYAKTALNGIADPQLKLLLSIHLNPNASEKKFIFTKRITQDRKVETCDKDDALGIAFVTAPTQVTRHIMDYLLGLKPDAFCNLFNADRENRLLITILSHAPENEKKRLMIRLKNLPPEAQAKLLFFLPSSTPGTEFITLLKECKNQQNELIQLFCSLPTEILFKNCKTNRDYGAYINYFQDFTNEAEGILLLNLLESLTDEQCKQLIFSQETTLLNVVIVNQSTPVLEKFFQVLKKKCSIQDIKKLLDTRSYLAALGKEQEDQMCLLVNFLYDNLELRPYLTQVSFNWRNSLLKVAAIGGCLKTIRTYLEKKIINPEALVQISQAINQPEISVQRLALPIYRHLMWKEEITIAQLTALTKTTPYVLKTQWMGNSLLHLAAKYGDVAMVSFLLAHELSPQQLNDNKQTPFEIAVQARQNEVVALFIKHDANLIQSEFTAIPEGNQLRNLSRYLKNNEGKFSDLLLQFIAKEKDTEMQLVYEVARLIHEQQANEHLTETAISFVRNRIQKLQQFQTAENIGSLLIALFFIAGEVFIRKTLKKDPTCASNIGEILSLGLQQSSIYRFLPETDFHAYLNLLTDSKNQPAIERLLTHLWQSPYLVDLPATICLRLVSLDKNAQQLDKVCSLLRSNQVEISPILMVLGNYQSEFQTWLNRFITGELHIEEKELFCLLDLIPTDSNMTNELNNDNALLAGRVHHLLINYSGQRRLNPQGFLRQKFIHMATQSFPCLAAPHQFLIPQSQEKEIFNFYQYITQQTLSILPYIKLEQIQDPLLRHCLTLRTLQQNKLPLLDLWDEADQERVALLAAGQNDEAESYYAIAQHLYEAYLEPDNLVLTPEFTDALARVPSLAEIVFQVAKTCDDFVADRTRVQSWCENEAEHYKSAFPKLRVQLTEAVLAKPCSMHVELYFDWLLRFSDPIDFETLRPIFSTHAELISKRTEARVQNLFEQADFLRDLQIFFDEKIKPQQFIEKLLDYPLPKLQNTQTLSEYAGCEGLTRLIEQLIDAKIKKTPPQFLIQSIFISVPSINGWLEQLYQEIRTYKQQLSSLVIYNEMCQTTRSLDDRFKAIEDFVNQDFQRVSLLVTKAFISCFLSEVSTVPQRERFLNLAHSFVQEYTPEEVMSLFEQTPSTYLTQLVRLCLDALASGNNEHARVLLRHLCQQECNQNVWFSEMKRQLGAQDLNLLQDKSLISIAENILKTKSSDLMEQTYDGVWIQRLFIPEFIRICPFSILEALIVRYELISLTLKQDEFRRYNKAIQDRMSFFEYHCEQLKDLIGITTHPLIARRQRLKLFRAADSIRALLVRVEEKCLELMQDLSQKTKGEEALLKLHEYYRQQLGDLKINFFNRITHSLFVMANGQKGDLLTQKGTLGFWVKKYLSPYNFIQQELVTSLEQASSIFLYNQQGEQIAFLNDNNYVMLLDGDVPCSILQLKNEHAGARYPVGSLFYDKTGRQVRGELLASGQFKPNTLFQQQTSALLLSKVPIEQLKEQPNLVHLLLKDVLNHNQLEMMYGQANQENRGWLTQQITNTLPEIVERLTPESINSLVINHKSSDLVKLISRLKTQTDRHALFMTMLKRPTHRVHLFHLQPSQLSMLFSMLKIPDLLAEYLEKHHLQNYFEDGLTLFANEIRYQQKPHYLSDGLKKLAQSKTIDDDRYNTILNQLLVSDRTASVLWNALVEKPDALTIQENDNQTTRQFTAFFYKPHCLGLLNALVTQTSWRNSYQYRFFLLLLLQRFDKLIPAIELRYSERTSWTAAELYQLKSFIKRHLRVPSSLDENQQIGFRLLRQVIERLANLGDCDLFYNDNKFSYKLAQHVFPLSPPLKKLEDNIDDFCENDESMSEADRTRQALLLQQLKEEKGVINWARLQVDTEKQYGDENIPLLFTFLANYHGDLNEVEKVIQEILNSSQRHDLLPIIEKLSERDISTCVFQQLNVFYSNQPSLLTPNVFRSMAAYWMKKSPSEKESSKIIPLQAEFMLIDYFGKQKKYDLVKKCCRLLYQAYKDDLIKPGVRKQIEDIHLIANCEQELSMQMDKWYFSIWKLIKRLWSYFQIDKTNFLPTFCEQPSQDTSPIKTPKVIKNDIEGAQSIAKKISLNKESRALEKRAKPFMEAYASKFFRDRENVVNVADESRLSQSLLPSLGTTAMK